MPRIIGYLRADKNGQDELAQRERLQAFEVTQIIREQPASAKRDRPELDKLLEDLRAGDTLVVTSLNRIARNTKHLQGVVESLSAAGVTFKVLDNGIDTSAPHGETLRMLLGAIADFERQIVRENQSLGIARAKREGRYKGRKPTAMAKADEVLALNAQGLTRQKIAEQSGIGVASVYRILKNHATPKKPVKAVAKKPVDKPKRVERKPAPKPAAEQLSFF